MKNIVVNRLRAFAFAFEGIAAGLRKELALKIHLIALLLLIPFVIGFNLSALECLLLFACACMVIVAEIFNTALEKLCDLVTLSHDTRIKYIKDLAAGGVLITVVLALAVGAIITWKHCC